LVTTVGCFAAAWAVDIRGALVAAESGGHAPKDYEDRYLADVQANHGNSGGPVFSRRDGSVVGVLIRSKATDAWGLTTNSNLAIVVPSRYIADLAQRHGVAWTSAD
jgi:S1-C subfamily serine protease